MQYFKNTIFPFVAIEQLSIYDKEVYCNCQDVCSKEQSQGISVNFSTHFINHLLTVIFLPNSNPVMPTKFNPEEYRVLQCRQGHKQLA